MEVLRLDFFRGERYQDLFRYMDSTGGFWLHRWGNNPFRTFAVGLLLDDENVSSMVLPYAHQDYCSCGPGAAPCSWESSAATYSCRPQDEATFDPASPSVVLEDLAQGLLDLQPWRGTERQRQRFKPADVYNF